MPFIHTADELTGFLKLEEVPASEVKAGDVIYAQGTVASVGEPKLVESGSLKFIEFAREVVSIDGYERVITLKPDQLVKRVPRAWLA